MSVIDQLKSNAKFVVDKFGPVSGLANFGYNKESIAYIDSYIDRQHSQIEKDAQSHAKFVSLFASFLGEAIIATYGGEWTENDHGPAIQIKHGDSLYLVQPAEKVSKRIANGREDSLESFFAEFIPSVLGLQPPTASTKKPGWKFW